MLYWCAIFCFIGFVFLFFFMEETNYVRHTQGTPVSSTPGTSTPNENSSTKETARGSKEVLSPTDDTTRTASSVLETGAHTHHTNKRRKTYWDKLKLFQEADLHKANELKGMVYRPLAFLTFPVIFYAGFSYGANLV